MQYSIHRVAFITGITGQDGSYLAELLLGKAYFVHGLIRRSSTMNTSRIEHLFHNPALKLHYGDMTDGACLYKILSHIKTAHPLMERLEIYNLAAQSHVKISFEMPEYTADTDAFGTLKLLEAVRNNELTGVARFYQASTSELYGKFTWKVDKFGEAGGKRELAERLNALSERGKAAEGGGGGGGGGKKKGK